MRVGLSIGLFSVLIFLQGCANLKPAEEDRSHYSPSRAQALVEDIETELVASPDAVESATLDGLLQYAFMSNPSLRAAYARWRAALERIAQVGALPDPRLSYEIMARVSPREHTVMLSQMFPWFGKLTLEQQMADEEAALERLRFCALRLDVFQRIKRDYYELYYLNRRIAIAEDNVALLLYFEEVARAKYTTGMAGFGDIIRAELERARLEDEVASLSDAVRPLLARINQELNRPPQSPIASPENIAGCSIELSADDISALLEEGNPDLLAAKTAVIRDEIGIEIARKRSIPDVELGIGFREIEDSDMPMSDNGRDPVLGMISMNLPIWRTKYRAIQREAMQRHQMAIEELADVRNRLSTEVEMVLYSHRDARRKLVLYDQQLIPKAQQVVNVTQQAFATGKVDFLELVDAQRVFLELQVNRERALTDCALSISQLETLLGSDVWSQSSHSQRDLQ